jgi:hypothetical protein
MAAHRETAFVSSFFCREVTSAKGVAFLRQASDLLVRKYEGRPHFGKIHQLNSETLARAYGKGYTKFALVKQSLDPHGKFSNDYIRQLFPLKACAPKPRRAHMEERECVKEAPPAPKSRIVNQSNEESRALRGAGLP